MFGGLLSIGKSLLGGGLGKLIAPVGGFLKSAVSKVGDFVKPVWGGIKKVASFIPGGDMLTSAVEDIGGSMLGGLGAEAEEGIGDVQDMGESIADTSMKTYGRTRGELQEGLSSLRGRGGRMRDIIAQSGRRLRDAGRQFTDTARSRQSWGDMYGGPDEEDEYAERRYRARQARRKQRRYEDYE